MKPKILPLVLVFSLLGLARCAPPLASGALAAGVESASAGHWDDAVRQWTRAIEQDPGSAAAHGNLAVAFEKQGAWEEARREYELALRLDPANRTIRDNYEAFKARLEAGRGKTS